MTMLPIKDFPDYFVDDEGNVYSKKYHPSQNRFQETKKMLYFKTKEGYLRITLRKKGKSYIQFVHRLVAETWLPNPQSKPCVNHINGTKTDNSVSNLEWCDYSENMLHAFHVLGHKASKTALGKFGKLHPRSKIIQQIKNGKTIASYYGSLEASRKTGISAAHIGSCCRNEYGYKTAGGYQWKYIEQNKG